MKENIAVFEIDPVNGVSDKVNWFKASPSCTARICV